MGLITNLLLAPILGPLLPFILLAKLFLSLAFLPVFLLLLPVLIPWWIAKVSGRGTTPAEFGRDMALLPGGSLCTTAYGVLKVLIWVDKGRPGRPRRAAKGSEALAAHCVTRVNGTEGSR